MSMIVGFNIEVVLFEYVTNLVLCSDVQFDALKGRLTVPIVD